MNGIVERTDNGLRVTIEDYEDKTYNEIFDYLQHDLLFWEDMYFETFGNEWLYIEDENHNAVYMVTDYSYDCIDELGKRGETLIPKSNDSLEDYREITEQTKY